MIEMAKVNIFSVIKLDLQFCLLVLTMESNLATVDLTDFSHSLLMFSIKSLEMISVLEFLCASWDSTVCEFAAGI